MARTEISIERFITEARQKLGEKNVLTGPDTENFDVDFWKQYRGQSACVLKPGSTNDVVEIVRLARKHNVTLVPQGGNTGLVNGGIPDLTGTQAIISLARMNHIRSLDPAGDYIIVEAGDIHRTQSGEWILGRHILVSDIEHHPVLIQQFHGQPRLPAPFEGQQKTFNGKKYHLACFRFLKKCCKNQW